METLSSCPVCLSQQFFPFIECQDFTVSRETFDIVQCGKCSFKFTNPRPAPSEIGKYYDSDNYISHSNSNKGLFNTVYQKIRQIALKSKVSLIESLAPNQKNLLDIGCGTGEFLCAAKNAGWNILGLEPSQNARLYAINQNKLDVKDIIFLDKIPSQSFDIITMWHVLEHIPNLHQFVHKIKNILKDKGTLIVAVPNCEAYEAQIYKSFWAAYDVPRHLNHFSMLVINKLFKTNCLSIIKIQTMPFDAYYISMLSEKYKGSGLVKMGIKGLVNGFRSNRASAREIANSSSLIYIINKDLASGPP